jgi:peptidoglycan/xylan/chitin deacetylase (PgdA/CDA1 family)
MAIGSHTSTHVRGRTLSADDFGPEIADNRTRLEEMTSRPVEAFSVPYGSMADLTPGLAAALAAAGHDFVFLVEGQLNHGSLRSQRMFRVSLNATTDLGSRLEIEVWPRIRRLRDLVTRR